MLTALRAATTHCNMRQQNWETFKVGHGSLFFCEKFPITIGGAYDYKNHSMLKLNHPCGKKCTAFHLSNEASLRIWIFFYSLLPGVIC